MPWGRPLTHKPQSAEEELAEGSWGPYLRLVTPIFIEILSDPPCRHKGGCPPLLGRLARCSPFPIGVGAGEPHDCGSGPFRRGGTYVLMQRNPPS